jgi:hypothetical protein
MTGSLKKARRYLLLLPIAISGTLLAPAGVLADTAPGLGAAASFAVLAGQTVTNTGNSVISGDLGVSPGSAVTGFPPGIVMNGSIHAADAVAANAQSALTAAYNSAAANDCDQNLSGTDLGGLTLNPGTYCFSSSAQLTGDLRLNGAGVYIFKIVSTLNTASGARVLLINGASACSVFWQVGSSASLGTTTTFAGTIMALTSISVKTGASIAGRALARNGSVTLDTNAITNCSGPTPVVSEAPLTILIPSAALAILATAVVLRRRRVRMQSS